MPVLGAEVEGNVIEDAAGGGVLYVQHGGIIKSNAGRVYMSAALRNNTVQWTPAFLSRRAQKGAKDSPPGLTLGCEGSLDPGELVVDAAGNLLRAPAGTPAAVTLKIFSALYNGKKLTNQKFSLPPEDSSARVGRRN